MQRTDGIVIREDTEQHMAALRAWLSETEHVPLEEMTAFFRKRLDGYESHMSAWAKAYEKMAALLPEDAHTLLDLGAGTGLELDAIFAKRSDIDVTCIDLSQDMLARLKEKHPEVTAVSGDYFTVPLEKERFDAVIAFETLHHFTGEQKLRLFRRIFSCLKKGGVFLEADYIACCDEEETLLAAACRKKRMAAAVPEEMHVHFDTPLTAGHETALLRAAGFVNVHTPCAIDGACFVLAGKP